MDPQNPAHSQGQREGGGTGVAPGGAAQAQAQVPHHLPTSPVRTRMDLSMNMLVGGSPTNTQTTNTSAAALATDYRTTSPDTHRPPTYFHHPPLPLPHPQPQQPPNLYQSYSTSPSLPHPSQVNDFRLSHHSQSPTLAPAEPYRPAAYPQLPAMNPQYQPPQQVHFHDPRALPAPNPSYYLPHPDLHRPLMPLNYSLPPPPAPDNHNHPPHHRDLSSCSPSTPQLPLSTNMPHHGQTYYAPQPGPTLPQISQNSQSLSHQPLSPIQPLSAPATLPPVTSSSSAKPPHQLNAQPPTAATARPAPSPAPAPQPSTATAAASPAAIPATVNQIPPGGAPARRYLNDNVTPILLEGMKMLAREQPKDPLLVLAQFLEEKHNELEQTKVKIEGSG
ncbi:COMPASS (complex proteins associated with Set1p) component [Rhizina undulata]